MLIHKSGMSSVWLLMGIGAPIRLGFFLHSAIAAFIPGLLMDAGVGVMLTASVNVVQSSFPEPEQGEISDLSHSVSNLGSSLGAAIVGSVLVSGTALGGQPFAAALLPVVVVALLGLEATMLLPSAPMASRATR